MVKLNKDNKGRFKPVHGHSRNPEKRRTYKSWDGMMYRCNCPTSKDYPRYGGRGIKVCSQWKEPNGIGYSNFLKDMGERPKGHTLDRINNDGNYEPGNCRWATIKQQNRNKRTTKLNESKVVEIKESNKNQYLLAAEFGVKQSTISRIKLGVSWR